MNTEETYTFLSALTELENKTAHRHLTEATGHMEASAVIWDRGTNYGKHDFRATSAWCRLDENHRRILAEYIAKKVRA